MRSFRSVLLAGAVAAAATAAAAPACVRASCECRGVVADAVDAYAEAPHAALALARIFLALAPGSRAVPLRLGAFGVSLAAAVAAVSPPADGGGAPPFGAGVDADAAVAYAGYAVLSSWFEGDPAKARELDALFAAHGYAPGAPAAGHVGAVAARRVMARNRQGPPPAAPYKPVNPASPGYDATCDALVASKWQPQCVQVARGEACVPQKYTPGPLVNGSLFGAGGRKAVAQLVSFLPPPPEASGPLGDLDLSSAAAATVAAGPDDDSFVEQHAAVLSASTELGDYGKAAADYFSPPAALRTFSLAVAEAAARDLPLAEAATLFAMSGAAIADAFIATQYVKARYSSVRPLTVLQCGGHSRPLVGWAAPYEGVRPLRDDERWGPYLQTPGFPGYTSGHSAVAAAGARALARYFGRGSAPRGANCGRVPAGGSLREPRVEKGAPGYVAGVTDVANRGPRTAGYAPAADVSLCWSSWWGYADLVSASRLAGGIHIPVDNSRGLAVGVAAADQVVEWVKGGMA